MVHQHAKSRRFAARRNAARLVLAFRTCLSVGSISRRYLGEAAYDSRPRCPARQLMQAELSFAFPPSPPETQTESREHSPRLSRIRYGMAYGFPISRDPLVI